MGPGRGGGGSGTMEVGSCYRPGLPFLLRKPPLPSPTCSTPSNLRLPGELNCEPSCGFIAFALGPGCEPPRGQSRSPVEVVKAGSLVSMWTCWGLSPSLPSRQCGLEGRDLRQGNPGPARGVPGHVSRAMWLGVGGAQAGLLCSSFGASLAASAAQTQSPSGVVVLLLHRKVLLLFISGRCALVPGGPLCCPP